MAPGNLPMCPSATPGPATCRATIDSSPSPECWPVRIGVEILDRAIERGTLVGEDVTRDPDYATHKIQTRRKGTNAPLRVARRLRHGHPAPIYDRAPPKAGLREQALERGTSFLLWLGGFRWFRYPLMKFLTSAGAIPLINFRLWRKKRKYRKLARRQARAATPSGPAP